MLRSLRAKFLILLLGVAAVALSGTFVLRDLMMRDFAAYLEGEGEDRAYRVVADLESAYERRGGWNVEAQAEDALRALTLGFGMRLLDENERLLIDTEKALRDASPLVERRFRTFGKYVGGPVSRPFETYPLFLGGRQIGTLELREVGPAKGAVFLRRTNRFLILSVLMVGGLAILLSVLFSRRLTRPLNELARAASAISRGDLKKRVALSRRDEVGDLAETFNGMAKALDAQETLRRKLIADVAHELRTPLGVMRGELEAMIDGLIPNDPTRLESLYEETGRLRNMVNAIEDLNQAEASTLSLIRRRFEVRPFLENIVERHRGSFLDSGVALELECRGNLEAYADPERLSQIVLNLISNACRATGKGGRVSITAAGTERETLIVVEDSGTGISDEDLPFVFERFYHGTGGGLGIGLTIVKELAEAHGGTVHVSSVLGEGSVFTVCLPSFGVHNSS